MMNRLRSYVPFLLLPLAIPLVFWETHLKVSTTVHQLVQISIIFCIGGLVWIWETHNYTAGLRKMIDHPPADKRIVLKSMYEIADPVEEVSILHSQYIRNDELAWVNAIDLDHYFGQFDMPALNRIYHFTISKN